jgi:hypothetical protein
MCCKLIDEVLGDVGNAREEEKEESSSNSADNVRQQQRDAIMNNNKPRSYPQQQQQQKMGRRRKSSSVDGRGMEDIERRVEEQLIDKSKQSMASPTSGGRSNNGHRSAGERERRKKEGTGAPMSPDTGRQYRRQSQSPHPHKASQQRPRSRSRDPSGAAVEYGKRLRGGKSLTLDDEEADVIERRSSRDVRKSVTVLTLTPKGKARDAPHRGQGQMVADKGMVKANGEEIGPLTNTNKSRPQLQVQQHQQQQPLLLASNDSRQPISNRRPSHMNRDVITSPRRYTLLHSNDSVTSSRHDNEQPRHRNDNSNKRQDYKLNTTDRQHPTTSMFAAKVPELDLGQGQVQNKQHPIASVKTPHTTLGLDNSKNSTQIQAGSRSSAKSSAELSTRNLDLDPRKIRYDPDSNESCKSISSASSFAYNATHLKLKPFPDKTLRRKCTHAIYRQKFCLCFFLVNRWR